MQWLADHDVRVPNMEASDWRNANLKYYSIVSFSSAFHLLSSSSRVGPAFVKKDAKPPGLTWEYHEGCLVACKTGLGTPVEDGNFNGKRHTQKTHTFMYAIMVFYADSKDTYLH